MNSNTLFMHSGGVAPVVNAVASTINQFSQAKVLYVCPFGVNGLVKQIWQPATSLDWRHIDTSPALAFGSSRSHTPDPKKDIAFYEALFKKFESQHIHTFLCNGGNNSQHITQNMHTAAQILGYDLKCIGIPKTIDNDILHTDTCVGFGSAAKYTATSCMEVSLDLAAMCHSGSQVLIYQTMGRNVGWLAASSALAKSHPHAGPHIILVPEAQLSIDRILSRARDCIKDYNHVVICLAEGVKVFNQHFPNAPTPAHKLAELIKQEIGLSSHIVIPDYLQRAARHIASETDIQQAAELSKAALLLANQGRSGIMTTIVRKAETPYQWRTGHVDLEKVAGQERPLPTSFLSQDGLHINQRGIDYIKPLIQGESFPRYVEGMPQYSNAIYTQQMLMQD